MQVANLSSFDRPNQIQNHWMTKISRTFFIQLTYTYYSMSSFSWMCQTKAVPLTDPKHAALFAMHRVFDEVLNWAESFKLVFKYLMYLATAMHVFQCENMCDNWIFFHFFNKIAEICILVRLVSSFVVFSRSNHLSKLFPRSKLCIVTNFKSNRIFT